jgi:hypothetical protein
MSLTISPSPFGSLVVSVAETGSTLSVTTVATSPSVLTMALGVPGPAGATGSQGPAGTNGTNGVGVPVGGTTGQVLSKINSTNYNTQWTSPSGGTWGSITGTLSSQTDLQNALNAKLSTSAAASTYLPLSGGTLTGNLVIDTGSGSQGHYETTEMFVTRTDATGTSANAYGALFNGGVEVGDSTGKYAELNPNYLRFGDGSTQASAYNPSVLNGYLPLTGGTLSNSITIRNSGAGYRIENVEDTPGTHDFYKYFSIGLNGMEVGGDQQRFSLNANELRLDDNISYGSTGITFPDSTQQITAFPPTGGTTSQFIDGTGGLQTYGPLGDRYLTSSTSTLTCDSGNGKTMTVGTGLSYSRQQDITVSYDTANHMHGTVLTYNSTTGVMTFDSNTHSGSGTYSSWQVNVGGVAGAILPVGGTAGQVLAKINSTNFNTEWKTLGTMSSEPASAYLSTASAVANYLTISSASSTYQTQSGMSAYLSTSAAASTYQTQAGMSDYLSTSAAASTYQTQSGMSAYLSTASASANFIGTSAYATTAQAQAGTSTTTVVNPSTLLDAKFFAGYKPLSLIYTWTSATSGTGAFTTVSGLVKIVSAPTSATGYAQAIILNNNASRGQQYTSGADFTKRTTIGGRFVKAVTTADANSVFRFLLGKITPSTPAGDLSVRGIGFRQVANGALELQVHNGTTLYNVTSTFTPTANQCYDVVIVADGGTATMYVNGSSVATSANAPTALLGANTGVLEIEAQNTSTLSGSAMLYVGSDMFVQTNL